MSASFLSLFKYFAHSHAPECARDAEECAQNDWITLADRLSQIYSLREHPTLYLLADSNVPFQTVVDAFDTLDKLGIKIRLVTPKMFDAGCLLKPVVTGSSH
jgi:hypothetical protein